MSITDPHISELDTANPLVSEFDIVRANFKAYDSSLDIESYSNNRLISDYALAAAWCEHSPEAELALGRIVDEYYARHRIDLNVVAAHLGRPARFQTQVDDAWLEIERSKNHATHHRRRRLATYIAQ